VRPDDLHAALWASTGWIAFAVAAHFAVFHLVQVERRARTLVFLWGAALIGYLWTGLVLELDRWRILYGAVVLFCAFILYMPFHYTVSAAQSVQMLIELAQEPEGLTVSELRRRNPIDEVLQGRFETLLASGYVLRHEGRFALTAKARLVVRVFRLVRALWHLGPGG
jgi:hypothetical protein